MNDLNKNIELFVNILGMARTSTVEKWDKEAFLRAFKWAHYFEQVYKKTKLKPNVAEKISQQLEVACSDINAKLGLSPLSYSDFERATHILRKYLLENPYLSNEFYLELVSQLKLSEVDEMKKHIGSLSKLKAALQILQLMLHKKYDTQSEIRNRDIESHHKEHITKEKIQLNTNAELLKKCLKNILNSGTCNGSLLYKKLLSMVNQKKGIDVLIMTLVFGERDEKVAKYVLDFIKDVMVITWKNEWRDFLQIPSIHLFADCAKEYNVFFEEYLKMLEFCAEKLQKELEENPEIQFDFYDSPSNNECSANNGCSSSGVSTYYYLLQNSIQTLAKSSCESEEKVLNFLKKRCSTLSSNTSDRNVWKKLACAMKISM
ncbi:uncharacterized protein LOC100210454 isoform X1 [Hydra vulgaris]|uniref:uncharacterized protein LOC100210454 isoform X1 n=1 Tax=Hydra vulgaris TaxID=6087 RepID=UPI0001925F68|nr:uncharacterized protein LOC100210454 [Hydra vulgaris]